MASTYAWSHDSGGQDATDLFYSLHKGEVLLRPQYQRLQIGVVPGQEERFKPLPLGSLSPVPYGGTLRPNAFAVELNAFLSPRTSMAN